ncbi:hypothetical protein [Arthrobacter sp. NPDC093139]|uniref:hypothetical protein n=1 Tax=Arthrobacter sp. NPDC093139 TaxID=3363945 RepID=UPI003802EDA7
MKKMYAVMALAALALTGCSGGAQTNSAPPETAKATATPSPTPTIMTKAEAGKFYLATICPSNILSDKAGKAVQAEPFNLKAAKSATAALRDGYRKAIETLSNEKVLWPDPVKADVAALAESMYGDLSGAENAANQTTDAGFFAAWNDWTTAPAQPNAQKIRLKLGLSSDTDASCKIK